jgi:quercetin dioxygenase-like cupin family protein
MITTDPILEQLDRAVRAPGVSDHVAAIVERVVAKLQASHEVMAWETVDLSLFRGGLPAGIASCWVFVIRAGAQTGAERHPNSHQRSLSLAGRGEFQLRPKREWEPHPLSSGRDESLERRWVSIPANTWHRLLVGRDPWAMLSFHTVPSADLIEETPVGPDGLDRGPTERRRYADLA